MSRALIFWILMLIWLVFGLAVFGGYGNIYMAHAGTLLEFILFLLLGWAVYGRPIQA